MSISPRKAARNGQVFRTYPGRSSHALTGELEFRHRSSAPPITNQDRTRNEEYQEARDFTLKISPALPVGASGCTRMQSTKEKCNSFNQVHRSWYRLTQLLQQPFPYFFDQLMQMNLTEKPICQMAQDTTPDKGVVPCRKNEQFKNHTANKLHDLQKPLTKCRISKSKEQESDIFTPTKTGQPPARTSLRRSGGQGGPLGQTQT